MIEQKKPLKFNAPGGSLLIFTTVFFSLILCAISYSCYSNGNTDYRTAITLTPLGFILIGFFQRIRGYRIKGKYLYIRRLLWSKKIDVSNLKKIRIDSSAMTATYRFFGNPGLFSFSGIFWNDRLGCYHAYVTNFTAQIIIRLKNGKVIVVSPENPEEFLETLRIETR